MGKLIVGLSTIHQDVNHFYYLNYDGQIGEGDFSEEEFGEVVSKAEDKFGVTLDHGGDEYGYELDVADYPLETEDPSRLCKDILSFIQVQIGLVGDIKEEGEDEDEVAD